ncbi:HsdR family type I site-specific deoxyribonuclease [Weissella viridescens]|uniref:type I restriction endonuclease subunit R n=1 Tax=Weissella viridescens TaxID=1629 RepID=UPI001C7D1296|nr:HsdR family type I site-specific deoxyribonuclease [Weissella viridescens]MBX4172984.1 HsdR family type I site-specific deoxyribonuclease [Weissella viridescens]
MVSDKSLAENQFQQDTVDALTGEFGNIKSWVSPAHLDGTTHKVTYQDLIDNWREILNLENAKELEGVKLTDDEFKQVMTRVQGIGNSYEAAKILAAENSTGKIEGIYRDAQGVTKTQITLRIFEKAQVNGGDSTYQIAREVWTEGDKNRFDIVLLINGLPLINIEQKRVDHSADEAFGQFKRYYRDGEYTHNFFAFSQMMVIMTDIDTRYFATPKSLDAFNPSFQFRLADHENRPLTKMSEITKTLLRIPMAHQMVGDYLIINEDAKDESKRLHMLMRPYQVEALRAIELAASGMDNTDHIPHGGYVWHTTGSGKTITSFKAATSLSKKFEKVIFLLDRKDLDKQTSENFKAYSQYESIDVDDSPYTIDLKRKMESSVKGVVVATTFKLSNVIKDLLENGDPKHVLNKNMAIIIDEAHRTTMGNMMMTIKNSLPRTLFYGFTGTPLFDESEAQGIINDKAERIHTTEQMFGNELHRYTIDQAIKDRNVLGFKVDYIDTGEIGNYADLADRWVSRKLAAHSGEKSEDEILTEARELENNRTKDENGIVNGRATLENEVVWYNDADHIPVVVEEILNDWEKRSKGIINNEVVPYKFNAMLTVALKPRVIEYYKEFKKQLAERDMKLNITATFSEDNQNTESGEADKENLTMLFDDWHAMGHPQYNANAGRPEQNESGFFSDITTVFKRGGHAYDENNIDLIIVAERLLTGYDSKLMNTLYVDRRLKLQGLIQAYSRTNRVYGADKEFGTIVNYQFPARSRYDLEKALWLYGSGGASSKAVVAEYPVAVAGLKEPYLNLEASLADPTDWIALRDNKEATESFLDNYREVSKYLRNLSQYYEFDWNGTGDRQLPLTEETWLQYQGAYQNLRPVVDEQDDDDAVELGAVKLADRQEVTFDEIIRLIDKVVNDDQQTSSGNEENIRLINEAIMDLRNFGNNDNAELLQAFMNEVIGAGKLEGHEKIEDVYGRFVKAKGNSELERFAKVWAVDPETLHEVYDHYEPGSDVVDYMDDLRASSNYKESEWFQNPENEGIGLPALKFKSALKSEILPWLKQAKALYGNLNS